MRSDKGNNENMRRKKTKKKKNKVKLIVFTIFTVLVLFAAGFSAYSWYMLNKFDRHKIDNSDSALGIHEEIANKTSELKDVTNIALFGIDNRSEGEHGRSDSIIILTIDKKHDKIKLSSIMRDSYVNIDGHGKDKINHAYAFGGPQLAIKTINQNYGLNIRDFVTVDFNGLAEIIDALGGLQINIRKDEVQYVNNGILEVSNLNKKEYPYIDGPGMLNLNGVQAVSYSRIRSTAGGDFERTDRQRLVLELMFKKIQTAGVTKYPALVNSLSKYVTTSLGSSDMIKIGTEVLTNGITTVEQQRFPLDGYSTGKTINKVWYLVYNDEVTRKQIYDYIFDDIKPNQGNPDKPDLGNTSTKSSTTNKTSGTTKSSGTSSTSNNKTNTTTKTNSTNTKK